MGLFGRRKKKRQEEARRNAELARQEEIKKQKELEAKKQVEVKPKQEVKQSVKKTASKPVEKKGPSGKYEVYPEAGLFKYRLKASNGEVLAVSFGYATRKSAKSGIETFKNAVENGQFELSTDKSGFSHFDLFGARGARVIIIGEFYKTLKLAESAMESVKRFYQTNRVVDLDEIPKNEIQEEIVKNQKVDQNPSGKYQLVKEGTKSYFIKLIASNGQVLLVSQRYASKQSAMNGLETIQNAIEKQNFTVYRDKQNRYQFKLYSDNKQLIVSGETYPVKQSCLSAIESVLRFAGQAKFVE